MKIYISADIEGVTGVTHWDETDLNKADSQIAREQMTAEVVAACEGALQAGASEIWVKDAHWTGRNIIASKLPKEVKTIRGWSGSPMIMVQELDITFQGVVFIGYHARAGMATNPLSHTMTGQVASVTINDRQASEFLIHAYAAAYLKVPVVFVSGDKGLCADVSQFNPYIQTVAVKQGIGNSTINIHPELATALIREGVAKALTGDMNRFQVTMPANFITKIQYKEHTKAYLYGNYPGANQVDACTVKYENKSYAEIMRFMLFAMSF